MTATLCLVFHSFLFSAEERAAPTGLTLYYVNPSRPEEAQSAEVVVVFWSTQYNNSEKPAIVFALLDDGAAIYAVESHFLGQTEVSYRMCKLSNADMHLFLSQSAKLLSGDAGLVFPGGGLAQIYWNKDGNSHLSYRNNLFSISSLPSEMSPSGDVCKLLGSHVSSLVSERCEIKASSWKNLRSCLHHRSETN